MDPVADSTGTSPCNVLCNLAFMMREHQVHSTSVDVEFLSKVFLSHNRALQVPAGEALAPRTRPVHYVLRFGLFPKGKIIRGLLVTLAIQGTGSFQSVIQISAREDLWTLQETRGTAG